MLIGDIVYLPFDGGYVKYKVHSICDDEILVITLNTKQSNWLNVTDVLNENEFNKIYNNETIYE